jgi:hypothetical protein
MGAKRWKRGCGYAPDYYALVLYSSAALVVYRPLRLAVEARSAMEVVVVVVG